MRRRRPRRQHQAFAINPSTTKRQESTAKPKQHASNWLPFLRFTRRSRHSRSDFANSDDATKEALSFTVTGGFYGLEVPCESTPGTALLGMGERFNMPRPVVDSITISPQTPSTGQVIEISEVRHVVRSGECSGEADNILFCWLMMALYIARLAYSTLHYNTRTNAACLHLYSKFRSNSM